MDKHMPIGAQFSLIGRAFKKELDTILAEEDITGVQFGVLIAISDYERSGSVRINQRMLEKSVHVTHPTMTGIIKKLRQKGFIECHAALDDKRCNCISSTGKSRYLLARMDKANDTIWEKLSDGLTDEQKAQLFSFTELIINNICMCRKDERSDQ